MVFRDREFRPALPAEGCHGDMIRGVVCPRTQHGGCWKVPCSTGRLAAHRSSLAEGWSDARTSTSPRRVTSVSLSPGSVLAPSGPLFFELGVWHSWAPHNLLPSTSLAACTIVPLCPKAQCPHSSARLGAWVSRALQALLPCASSLSLECPSPSPTVTSCSSFQIHGLSPPPGGLP